MKKGLEERVGGFVSSVPHEELVSVRHYIRKPPKDQLNLFDFHGNSVQQSTLGLFYELVGYGLYGGVLYGSRRFPKRGYPVFDSNPDTVDLEKQEMTEYKSSNANRTLILRDGQVQRYASDQVAYPKWGIRSVMFRHGLPDIRSFDGTETQMFSILSKSTRYGLDLPLSVLIALHEGHIHNNGKTIASRSESDTYPYATRVASGFLNEFFFDPINSLKHLGLDESMYKVSRFLTPSKFFVDNKRVRQFPILKLNHVDLESWRNTFVSTYDPDAKKEIVEAPLYDIPV